MAVIDGNEPIEVAHGGRAWSVAARASPRSTVGSSTMPDNAPKDQNMSQWEINNVEQAMYSPEIMQDNAEQRSAVVVVGTATLEKKICK